LGFPLAVAKASIDYEFKKIWWPWQRHLQSETNHKSISVRFVRIIILMVKA
jgi:hypothetical protein